MIESKQQQAPADHSPTDNNDPSLVFRRLALPVMCLVSLFGFGVDKGFRAIGSHLNDNLGRNLATAFDNPISLDDLRSKLKILSTSSVRLERDRITDAEYIRHSAFCIGKEFKPQDVSARDLINALTQLSKALDTNYQPGKDNLVNEPAKTALKLLNQLLPPDSL